VAEHVSGGKLRVLAVTTAKRHSDYPDVPTLAELGFPGFEDYAQPIGFIAPAGLPMPIAATLDKAIAAALEKPAMQARLKSLGARFSAPVYPGETIRIEGCRSAAAVHFQATVPARQVLVLSQGYARIA